MHPIVINFLGHVGRVVVICVVDILVTEGVKFAKLKYYEHQALKEIDEMES